MLDHQTPAYSQLDLPLGVAASCDSTCWNPSIWGKCLTSQRPWSTDGLPVMTNSFFHESWQINQLVGSYDRQQCSQSGIEGLSDYFHCCGKTYEHLWNIYGTSMNIYEPTRRLDLKSCWRPSKPKLGLEPIHSDPGRAQFGGSYWWRKSTDHLGWFKHV